MFFSKDPHAAPTISQPESGLEMQRSPKLSVVRMGSRGARAGNWPRGLSEAAFLLCYLLVGGPVRMLSLAEDLMAWALRALQRNRTGDLSILG